MTWTAPAIERPAEPKVGDELTLLTGWLDYHRRTLLSKCQGLSADQLKQATVEPSSLTLLGLVRHMAEVERWWFRSFRGVPGVDPDIYCSKEYPDGDFDLVADADPAADFATFDAEVEAARAVMVDADLDESYPARRGDGRISLRWIYIHMIEEYARHNGHADLIRERLDGATGV